MDFSWVDELLDDPDVKNNLLLSDEKLDVGESSHQGAKGPTEKEANKRAKQKCAKRSRVRKDQYIAELERNVQALQVEGSEVTAKMEFVNQQNLNLSMENEALKQNLEDLSQEHLVKCLERGLPPIEVGRLRNFYLQMIQQQPQTSSGHRHANSRDLDQRFSNHSLHFS